MTDLAAPKLWLGPASKRGHYTATLLATERLQVGEIPEEQRDTIEKHLTTFATNGEALSKDAQSIKLTTIHSLELNPASAELSIDYEKEPATQPTNIAVSFTDTAQAQEAFAALRDRLGAGWRTENERQSPWKAATNPCKFLLLTVGLPAFAVLIGALGGDMSMDMNSKEDFFGCLYCIAVIAGVVLGIIYLGVFWMLAIGAGLLLVWSLWLWATIARRPDLSRLIRG
jgi:hypothetical protein